MLRYITRKRFGFGKRPVVEVKSGVKGNALTPEKRRRKSELIDKVCLIRFRMSWEIT